MKNKINTIFLILVAIFGSISCQKEQSTIYISAGDFTASIDEAMRVKAVKLPETIDIKRNDTFLLLPITADALTQTTGETLRKDFMPKSETETIYDQDIKRLKEELQNELPTFIAKNMRKNYQKSDILGTVKIIAEEVSLQKQRNSNRKIVVSFFSDMVHDTKLISFLTDKHFASSEESKKIAAEMAKENGQIWKDVEIFVGMLQSSDLQKMDENRRNAIKEFWLEYFRLSGCENPVFATDGIGQFQSFIKKEK
ncbi:MAG: hypothetical protein MUC29_09890, partial [Pyrinomonadaceae bacterium]|jgi:hypothetical protein|nr:hypothetical protein [Pyrinomonadaceae bacterium]